MRSIDVDGILYIKIVPGCGGDWYYGVSYEHGDLFEAEELFKRGIELKGRRLCLVHYPDGEVFRPVPKERGRYAGEPVYEDGRIYIPNVDFPAGEIHILAFDCASRETYEAELLPLSIAKDCYNLSLVVSPLTLVRQRAGEELELLWPERAAQPLAPNESFYHRDGGRLFVSQWFEDPEYREETVIKSISGEVLGRLPGSVEPMPNGELWHLK